MQAGNLASGKVYVQAGTLDGPPQMELTRRKLVTWYRWPPKIDFPSELQLMLGKREVCRKRQGRKASEGERSEGF